MIRDPYSHVCATAIHPFCAPLRLISRLLHSSPWNSGLGTGVTHICRACVYSAAPTVVCSAMPTLLGVLCYAYVAGSAVPCLRCPAVLYLSSGSHVPRLQGRKVSSPARTRQ